MSSYLRDTRDGVELLVLVQPRASRTRIVGEHEGRLKIAVSSPPVDGAANEALLEFLSEVFAVGKRAVELGQGESGRRKLVRIRGVLLAAIEAALKAHA